MINYVPRRYTEPKWLAQVTPTDKALVLGEGESIRSLLDLKRALVSFSEDVITKHIQDGSLVSWVKNVVGDTELAEELAKYQHRWGMIVALERQMMRTLNMPPYLAKRWLSKTDLAFTFVSGEVVDSLQSLESTLEKVTDDAIAFHGERVPNDIAKWVYDVIGDYELADLLEEAQSRDQMFRFVSDHLEMLTDAAQE